MPRRRVFRIDEMEVDPPPVDVGGCSRRLLKLELESQPFVELDGSRDVLDVADDACAALEFHCARSPMSVGCRRPAVRSACCQLGECSDPVPERIALGL